jgi:S-adenosylmethionine hydrolase
VLSQYWNWYPAGTVHIAVVDPGVGTRRMPLVATGGGHVFLAPDNGLLSWVVRRTADFRAGVLRPEVHLPSGTSATFHGRDVFAYAAGLIASGRATPAEMAEPIASIVVGPWVAPSRENDAIWGEVVHVDRFGNAVTNITADDLGDVSRWRIEARSYIMHRVLRTYGDVAPHEKLALVNSSGMVEIAVCCGSAAERLDLRQGDAVSAVLRHEEPPPPPAPGDGAAKG